MDTWGLAQALRVCRVAAGCAAGRGLKPLGRGRAQKQDGIATPRKDCCFIPHVDRRTVVSQRATAENARRHVEPLRATDSYLATSVDQIAPSKLGEGGRDVRST